MYVSDSEFSRMIEHRQKWLDHKRQILREKFAQKKCNFCAKQEEIMFECKGCHAVVYCNRSHQKRDWTFGHSVFCKTNRDHLQVIIVWPSLSYHGVFCERKRTFCGYWRVLLEIVTFSPCSIWYVSMVYINFYRTTGVYAVYLKRTKKYAVYLGLCITRCI